MRVMVGVMVQGQHERFKLSDHGLSVNSEKSMLLIGFADRPQEPGSIRGFPLCLPHGKLAPWNRLGASLSRAITQTFRFLTVAAGRHQDRG
jgi:hypothetical protein